MGAKRVFCTIFYIIFSLIFTAILACNVTGILNHFNLLPNNFFTTTIDANLINPIHTALDSLGLLDSTMLLHLVYIFATFISVAFWFLCIGNLANVLRGTKNKGTSTTIVIFSIIMFAVLVASVVLLVYGGESVQNVLSNYYLIAQVILYLFTLIIAILALTITPIDNMPEKTTPQEEQSKPLSAQQREDRIKQILGDDEIDPRV